MTDNAGPGGPPDEQNPQSGAKKPRRVAKTMLDTGKPDLQAIEAASNASTNASANASLNASGPEQKPRRVPKTLIYPVGNLHRITMAEVEAAARQIDEEQAAEQAELAAEQAQQYAQQAQQEAQYAQQAQQEALERQIIEQAQNEPAGNVYVPPELDAKSNIAAQSITSSRISPEMPQIGQSASGSQTRLPAQQLPQSGQQSSGQQSSGQSSGQQPADGERRVARTLLFKPNRTLDGDESPAQPSENAGAGRRIRKRSYIVAKTMLDHGMLFDMSSRNAAKIEVKAQELARSRALEPVKPFTPVEAKKKALACPWSWEQNEKGERFQFCGKCKQLVYDFKGMEGPEAEALVFKRENIEKPVLYKRTDGKYMTADCPAGVQRRKGLIIAGLVAGMFVAGLITLMAMMPPPPPPKQAAKPEDETNTDIGDPFAAHNERVKNKGKSFRAKDGTYYYQPGASTDPSIPQAPVDQPAAGGGAGFSLPEPAPSTDSAEPAWQYSGDQDQGSSFNENPKIPDPNGGPVQQYSQSAPNGMQR